MELGRSGRPMMMMMMMMMMRPPRRRASAASYGVFDTSPLATALKMGGGVYLNGTHVSRARGGAERHRDGPIKRPQALQTVTRQPPGRKPRQIVSILGGRTGV
jgi:hypothetical protein